MIINTITNASQTVVEVRTGPRRAFQVQRFECPQLSEAISTSGLRVHGLTVTCTDQPLHQEATTSDTSRPSHPCENVLEQSLQSPGQSSTWLLFAQTQAGYLIRSDIVSLRMTDAAWVESVTDIPPPPKSRVQSDFTESTDSLQALFGITSSMVQVKSVVNLSDLANRLSLPVLCPGVRKKRTIALVECGKSPHTALGIWNAARALDIQILAIDKPGHWLSKPEYSDWHVGFIAIDRNPDAGFGDRVYEAVKASGVHVDGLATFFDPLFPGVAAAALKLGVHAAPVSAYEIASDKYRTSEFEGHAAVRVTSVEQAVNAVAEHASGLEYPVIIKPCSGWGSEGVFRCADLAELESNMSSIDFARHGAEVVVERYCDGPEVDANFILCDGKVLWHEISDDFPKDADDSDDKTGNTFIEVANVLPSALPQDEQDMLVAKLSSSLVRLGFTTGFFHLEARVDRSRAAFSKDPATGITDLRINDQRVNVSPDAKSPDAWLIEINARPPGLQAAWASRATYGIDFWGVAFACALNDGAAIRALAVPFASNSQYWMEIVFLPVPHGGVFDSDDVCEDVVRRRPDLAGAISRKLCFFKRGDTVPDPASGILTWVAYYLVYSRESRRRCIELAEEVRRETRAVIVKEGEWEKV